MSGCFEVLSKGQMVKVHMEPGQEASAFSYRLCDAMDWPLSREVT